MSNKSILRFILFIGIISPSGLQILSPFVVSQLVPSTHLSMLSAQLCPAVTRGGVHISAVRLLLLVAIDTDHQFCTPHPRRWNRRRSSAPRRLRTRQPLRAKREKYFSVGMPKKGECQIVLPGIRQVPPEQTLGPGQVSARSFASHGSPTANERMH